ncbi:MAG: NAD(P)/FAD-dependent oxidoreductase [Bacteriovoracaceae bacterium]
MSKKYDIIIIGSGMGALSLAGIMARYKKSRILILEKHTKPGGFTHTFKRKGKFTWDTGLHYVGELQDGSYVKNVFDYITHKKLKWQKMPEIFERFLYPDFKFEVNSDPIKYKNDLVAMFPEESDAIRKYFIDLRFMAKWHTLYFFSKMSVSDKSKMSDEKKMEFLSLSKLTTAEYIDKNFSNDKLKAILVSQVGIYGVVPEKSPFILHAVKIYHFLYGGWYPRGTSKSITDFIIPYLEKSGGKILLRHEVSQIIVQNNKAIGVRVNNQERSEFFADIIVSDAGAYNTYVKLLPELESILAYRNGILNYLSKYPSCTNLTLFLGLKHDPTHLGIQGENSWIFTSGRANLEWDLKSDDIYLYLSVPSLKNIKSEPPTVIVIVFCSYGPFEKWSKLPHGNRGEAYEKLKDDLTEKILLMVERHYPGFCDLIEFKELATPLSIEHYSDHYQGSIYGLPILAERFDETKTPWFSFKTPIDNFYLTGVDALSPGISGAVLSGVGAATHITQTDELLELFQSKRGE